MGRGRGGRWGPRAQGATEMTRGWGGDEVLRGAYGGEGAAPISRRPGNRRKGAAGDSNPRSCAAGDGI